MVSSGFVVALVAVVYIAGQSAQASRAHKGFFEALNDQQKEQVSIILGGGMSKAEIKEQLRHWVSSQPKETQVRIWLCESLLKWVDFYTQKLQVSSKELIENCHRIMVPDWITSNSTAISSTKNRKLFTFLCTSLAESPFENHCEIGLDALLVFL